MFAVDAVGGIIFGGHHPQTWRGWTFRTQTWVHLAEQLTATADSFDARLQIFWRGSQSPGRDADSIVVFRPFGLGALDLAAADFVRKLGLAQGKGMMIESFLP